MRLEETDVAMVCRAIEVYLRVAWGGDSSKRWPKFDFRQARTIDEALEGFTDERRLGKMRKYTLRLGNRFYPYMKLVFQELLVRDKFFFAVDTHDDLAVESHFADFDGWLEIKRANAEIKEQLEREWQAAEIPTFATVVSQIEQETKTQAIVTTAEGARIFLVDDDTDIATGVETILTRRGYRITKFKRAEEALEPIRTDPPDLIISDLEMPGMTGLDLARAVRADPRAKSVPFILATAAFIQPQYFSLIDGYLVKPFETSVLLKFVTEHLAKRKKG